MSGELFGINYNVLTLIIHDCFAPGTCTYMQPTVALTRSTRRKFLCKI